MGIWEPRETHPGYRFHVDGTDPDTGRFVCTAASLDGRPITNWQDACDRVLAECAAVQVAKTAIAKLVPAEMLKPNLDSDGDPFLDENGNVETILKDKHQPIVLFSPLGEVTEIVIPGARQFPGLTTEQCAAMAGDIATAMASHDLIKRLQPAVEYDLVESVVLLSADEAAAKGD